MKSRKFNNIYVNGCSHTAGHSLESKRVIESYVKKYNLEPWDNERDVNFPKHLKNHYKCELFDDSQCGSGAPRVVRRTWEYINNIGLDRAKKTLFILLFNTPAHRLEYYCKEINDYLIVNVQYDNNGNIKFFNVVEKYSSTDRKYEPEFFEGKITDDVRKWVEEYHDPLIYIDKIHNEIVGLFSYFEQHGIEYFYGFDTGDCTKPINYQRRINLNGCQTIYDYVNKYNLTLHHELENGENDYHPGYFGHLKFSEQLINFLNSKLTPTLWTFGDSFTQSFSSHFNTTNEWAVKYKNYIQGNAPKSYNELISDYFGFNLRNQGLGGSCNSNIFSEVIGNIMNGQIKKNDIIIVNWTHNRRFRLSNDFNQFSDVIEPEHHLPPNSDISSKTTQEISVNRSYYNIYYNELIEYMNILKGLLKDNLVYFWTWSEPIENEYYFKNLLDNRYILMAYNWSESSDVNKRTFQNNVDYIFYGKDITIEDLEDDGKIKKLINEKKVIGVVVDKLHGEIKNDIDNKLNLLGRQIFDTKDIISEFKNHILPFKKYSTIREETNNEVDDLHYGKDGHFQLSNDIIKLLSEDFKII